MPRSPARWDAIRPRADRPERSRPAGLSADAARLGRALLAPRTRARPVGRTRIRSADPFVDGGDPAGLRSACRRGHCAVVSRASRQARAAVLAALAGYSALAPTGVRLRTACATRASATRLFLVSRLPRSAEPIVQTIEDADIRAPSLPGAEGKARIRSETELDWRGRRGKGRMDPEADPAFCDANSAHSRREDRIATS